MQPDHLDSAKSSIIAASLLAVILEVLFIRFVAAKRGLK